MVLLKFRRLGGTKDRDKMKEIKENKTREGGGEGEKWGKRDEVL